ncbi:hypothetical protein EGR_01496 [Echinococcus granulosus]|uniref:Uncharacterized protein n=1 Tax=Echinococcus granulosus TaxID=6210 RepID=W6URJ9_ECHGR|nr:hypothetical protein EGR_01496 [Echinococcus granulosus]EUB63873.1 hypothetical protein EGR_01496 [Echinococcus granulosus]
MTYVGQNNKSNQMTKQALKCKPKLVAFMYYFFFLCVLCFRLMFNVTMNRNAASLKDVQSQVFPNGRL